MEVTGLFVINPKSWNIAMFKSIHVMTNTTQCGDGSIKPSFDGIAMLDGWENSKGATIEHDLAISVGIPCDDMDEYDQFVQACKKLCIEVLNPVLVEIEIAMNKVADILEIDEGND